MSNSIEEYNRLNNSFKKTYIFHVGANAGFFSEYNNMILAMLYCLKHRIKFVLYSKTANFGYKDGWTDYFIPFCEENKDLFHSKYNHRFPGTIRFKDRMRIKLYKLFHQVDYFTCDLWSKYRNKSFETETFNIPELGINGDIAHACSVLIKLTWNYNDTTLQAVNKRIESLHLPENYIGFHIRGGDKLIEHEFEPVDKYVQKAEMLTTIKDVFISTDDYTIIEEAREKYPEWSIYTLSTEQERGYFHDQFQNESGSDEKKRHYYEFFASIDVLSKSSYFIGTFSSNIGMHLGIKIGLTRCVGVDFDHWQIW